MKSQRSNSLHQTLNFDAVCVIKQIIIWLILCIGIFSPHKQFADEIHQIDKLKEEKVLKEKIDIALSLILNPNLFYTISRAVTDKENPSKIAKLYVNILVDKQGVLKLPNVQALPEKFKQIYLFHLEQDLNKEISEILIENPVPVEKKISFVDFKKPSSAPSQNHFTILQSDLLPFALFLAGLILFYLTWHILKKFLSAISMRKKTKPIFPKAEETFTIFDILNKANPSALMPYFLNEPMHSVALLLFPLSSERVSEILIVWPLEKQVTFFIALNELQATSDQTLIKKSFEFLNIEAYSKQFDEFAVDIFKNFPANLQNTLHEKILAGGINWHLDLDQNANQILNLDASCGINESSRGLP